MNCHQCKSYISAYLDEQLSFEQKEYLNRHAKSCASCGDEFRQMENLRKGLSGLDVLQTSSDFNARLWARICREEAVPGLEVNFTFRQKVKWALATCLATIAILSAIVLTDPRFNLLGRGENDMTEDTPVQREYQVSANSDQVGFVIDQYKPLHERLEVDKPSQARASHYVMERMAYPRMINSGEHFILPVVSTQNLTKEESH